MNTPPRRPGQRSEAPAFRNPLPPQVVDALQRGEKIEAIKLMRQLSGLGLVQAKDAVEASAHALGAGSGDGLSPGEVPRTGRYVWAVVLAAVFVFVVYRVLRGE